jgi:hypothetical protein
MAKHHSLPMTYEPKIPAVFDGTCTQTIRVGRKYAEGDSLLIFEWSGTPYKSKWGRRMRARVTEVRPVILTPGGIDDSANTGPEHRPCIIRWNSIIAKWIALHDGIDPPTGEELKRVLEAFHGPFPPEGIEAQIVRWEPEERSEG